MMIKDTRECIDTYKNNNNSLHSKATIDLTIRVEEKLIDRWQPYKVKLDRETRESPLIAHHQQYENARQQ
jgi:hypothetical protein